MAVFYMESSDDREFTLKGELIAPGASGDPYYTLSMGEDSGDPAANVSLKFSTTNSRLLRNIAVELNEAANKLDMSRLT